MSGGEVAEERGSTGVMWFRRDLRVHDHPALSAAVASFEKIVCLFVLDDRLLRGRLASANRAWFLRESLAELSGAITARGGTLVIREGRPEAIVPAIAREVGARAVFVSRDYSPFGRARDGRVESALAGDGTDFVPLPGVLAAEPEQIVNGARGAFAVFSAFLRRWHDVPPRAVLPPPTDIPGPTGFERLLGWGQDGFDPIASAADPLPAGEPAARARLERFIEQQAGSYAQERDRLDLAGTSRLSQDLRWGLISPAEVMSRSTEAGAGKFVQEVAWRDFYHHLAWYSPRVLREPYQRAFAHLDWENHPAALEAWKGGRTGYPVVDAAMRQLVTTGWMHNRARMIVASFLTKHLLIDYRDGERFFMEHLVDGDVSVNNGGWQWASSTGASAQPYFRVFNPVLQGKRFDPEGSYVRRWVPELAHYQNRFVHEPWAAPAEVQEAARCVVGRDYPAPIVPHLGAAARAMDFYSARRSEMGP